MDNTPSATLQEARDRAWFGTPEPPPGKGPPPEAERAVQAPDVTFLWTSRSKTALRERKAPDPDETRPKTHRPQPVRPPAPPSPPKELGPPTASPKILLALAVSSALLAGAMLMSAGLTACALLLILLTWS